MHGKMRNYLTVLVGVSEKEGPLRRCTWEDNIKIDLGEIE
jgi:hypothetical protein